MTTNVSAPIFAWAAPKPSASIVGWYSMQPSSARTIGTSARKAVSSSSRRPGWAVMTATTRIMNSFPVEFRLEALDFAAFRPRLAGLVRHADLVAHRVAQAVEIAPAPGRMAPALGVQPLGVGANVEERAPFLVARLHRI